MDKQQQIQQKQYEFPYHYIPEEREGRFSQTRHWSWGFRYLGGMEVVNDQLEDMAFRSLVDIGCGDGRFLREAARRYPGTRLAGVDYSSRAIALARAMNPGLEYLDRNILREPLEERFDVATAVEVLEHIPPDDLPRFLASIADALNEGGRLVCTVPHTNAAVEDKHYQHFNSRTLRTLLEPCFGEIRFVPFDHRSRLLVLLSRLLGGYGRHYVVTNERINTLFYRLYRKRWLYTGSEKECLRIAAICVKKSDVLSPKSEVLSPKSEVRGVK